MQAVQSCSPQLLQVQDTAEQEHATLFVSHISVLSSPEEYSQKEIDDARKRLIRICMDHLCTQSGRRPTEAELHDLARAIANKYNSLRDNPALGVRQNYTGIIGFLRRRMYNSTPSVSYSGRKPGIKCNKKAQMEREDSFSSGSSCMEASSEEETSGVHKAGRLQHPEGSISQICSFQKVNNCKDSLTELQILVAFSYLPLIVQSSSVKGKAAAHHVVHIVKRPGKVLLVPTKTMPHGGLLSIIKKIQIQ
ncbi:UNVERIFIED_CONTAM: hypothetical protein FKN15_014667 [Acipenser sinensis]